MDHEAHLRPVHQSYQPVVHGDDGVPCPEATPVSRPQLADLVHDELEAGLVTLAIPQPHPPVISLGLPP